MPLNFKLLQERGTFDCSPAAIEKRLQEAKAAGYQYQLDPAVRTFTAAA